MSEIVPDRASPCLNESQVADFVSRVILEGVIFAARPDLDISHLEAGISKVLDINIEDEDRPPQSVRLEVAFDPTAEEPQYSCEITLSQTTALDTHRSLPAVAQALTPPTEPLGEDGPAPQPQSTDIKLDNPPGGDITTLHTYYFSVVPGEDGCASAYQERTLELYNDYGMLLGDVDMTADYPEDAEPLDDDDPDVLRHALASLCYVTIDDLRDILDAFKAAAWVRGINNPLSKEVR